MVVLSERQSVVLEVGTDGLCQPMGQPSSLLRRFPQRRPYRLYHFLSDLDDLVEAERSDRHRLRIAAVLLQRFLHQADWIGETFPIPDETSGWGVHTLYDEPGYPFTVQTVSWLPGQRSPIHNHAAWSIVAILGDATTGRERNTFWRRVDDRSQPEKARLEVAGERLLLPGDTIGFEPAAIHCVEQEYAEDSWLPTFTFNIYGQTNYSQRYEYDVDRETVKNF
jgi:predicted metal-dependent enzyme (double-stranded beta helix superfamily)